MAFTRRDTAVKSIKVNITEDSTLLISGKTNINTFSCLFNVNKLKNPIPVSYVIEDNSITFNKTALVLDNTCFDCGGRAINNDFKDILKTEHYPEIVLFINEISFKKNASTVEANIDIKIAGVTNSCKIPVEIKKNKELLIGGNLKINLCDYNIKPPKKMFGMICVQEEIEIFFQLIVQEC